MVQRPIVSFRCIAQKSVLVSKETAYRAKACARTCYAKGSMAEASVFTVITRCVNRKRTSILQECTSSEHADGIIFARRVNVPLLLTLSLTTSSREAVPMDQTATFAALICL